MSLQRLRLRDRRDRKPGRKAARRHDGVQGSLQRCDYLLQPGALRRTLIVRFKGRCHQATVWEPTGVASEKTQSW